MADNTKAPDRLPANFDFSKSITVPDRLPADFKFQEPPANFNTAPNFKPSQSQEFFGQALEHAGNLIPGIGSLARGLVTHPFDTGVGVVRGIGAGIVDPIYDAANGHYGKALEGALELGAPFIGKGLGKLVSAGAEPLAETAMRVGKSDRLFEANPGKAIINETSSVRPKSIARDLGQVGGDLGRQLSSNAASSTTPGSLAPAARPIVDRIAKAQGAGATSTAEQLAPMRDYFQGEAPAGFGGATTPGPTGTPMIAPDQSASQLLNMRQEFTPNFKIKYGPAADSTTQEIGRQAYRGLSNEVKRVVPGAAEIDPRLHDIIAAKDAAESTSRNAGFFQRSAGRLAAHTGALAGGLAGYHYGGIPGAVAGIVGPELAASPTVQMLGARGFQYAGRGLQKVPPATGLFASPLVRTKQQ